MIRDQIEGVELSRVRCTWGNTVLQIASTQCHCDVWIQFLWSIHSLTVCVKVLHIIHVSHSLFGKWFSITLTPPSSLSLSGWWFCAPHLPSVSLLSVPPVSCGPRPPQQCLRQLSPHDSGGYHVDHIRIRWGLALLANYVSIIEIMFVLYRSPML